MSGNGTANSSVKAKWPSPLVSYLAPSMYRPLTSKAKLEVAGFTPTSITSWSSSSDSFMSRAVACLVAVKNASGNMRPPNHIIVLLALASRRMFNCSVRALKSEIQSVIVIVSGTTYFFQAFGTESVLKFCNKARRSFVALIVPSHIPNKLFRSFRTFLIRERHTSFSRLMQRHIGSLTVSSVFSIASSFSGMLPSKIVTFSPTEANGFPPPLPLLAFLSSFFPPADPPPPLDCNFNHLLNVLIARLIRNILSACTGNPSQAGLPLTGRFSHHATNCSRFRPSGEGNLCSASKDRFKAKSLLKACSQNRCLMKD
mmetsp:Transcript_54463/g.86584  ORF Transcript_54463/g.86584 Transcript_54463/m.86584 type:complete len:314 (+) Transcript_54463:251-1192(+)